MGSRGKTVWEQRGRVAPPRDLASALLASGWWGDQCLLDAWTETVRARPDATAVADRRGTAFTYRRADEASSSIAAWMDSLGIGPGDIVGVQLPNWSEFLPVFIAVMKIGATIAPLSTHLRLQELGHALSLCDSRLLIMPTTFRHTDFRSLAKGLIAGPGPLQTVMFVGEGAETPAETPTFAEVASAFEQLPREKWVSSAGEDIAAILFTSGSEAEAKGVMLSHDNLLSSEKAFASALSIGPDDTMLMPAPLGHATGFMHGVVMPMMVGATAVLSDVYDGTELASLIATHRITCGMAVPAVIDALICSCEKDRERMKTLRFLCCGGAPVPHRLLERARSLGVRLYSVYGSTESAPHTMTTHQDSDERVLTTDGRACPGVDIRIVDPVTRQTLPPGTEGEEASRGPAVFSGYLRAPETTSRVLDQDGWYYSGDLAVMDPDGYIRITGRIKDMIIRGGENISPAEVERILLGHPSIEAAAVLGVPCATMGQRSYAYLVARKGHRSLEVGDLKDYFIAEGISKLKIPEFVEYLKQMPLMGSGKIDRRALRRRLDVRCTEK